VNKGRGRGKKQERRRRREGSESTRTKDLVTRLDNISLVYAAEFSCKSQLKINERIDY
jgi:hypothetical protein